MTSSMTRGVRHVVLIVLALVACSPPAPPRPAPSTTTEARERVRAGTSGDYPPLSLWKDDSPESKPAGFAPALLEAFGRSAKVDVAWTRFRWPELSADLAAGRFDIAADGITVRPERAVLGCFTVPIARGGAVLLLRRPVWATVGSGVDALDRRELRIAVNRGGHLERVTRSLFRAATITAIPDNAGVRTALAKGDVDAAMTNTFEAPRWADGLPGIERVGPLTRDVTALWVRADRADLAARLDEWLLDEEASGRLAELRRRTLGDAGSEGTATPLDGLLAATSERLALMPYVAAAKARSGKAVEDTAQEERVIAAGNDAVARAAVKLALAPPPSTRSGAFFRAQISAAKDVQQRSSSVESLHAYDLEKELRPAIARITTRMAFLVVRLGKTPRDQVLARTREALGDSGVSEAHVAELADAVAGLAGAAP
jgi:cyclohexadienyl dehydratase